MEQERKRTQFSELSLEDKKKVSKKCFALAIECGFRGSVIKEKIPSPSPQFILSKAQYYADNFASASEKVVYMKAKNEYESLARSNGIFYRDDTKYQQYIVAISKIDKMEELDKYIKGNNPSNKEIPIHSLHTAIDDRKRALGDKDGLYSLVKNKLIDYDNYKKNKRSEANKSKSLLTLEENKLLSTLTLQDFLDSEFIDKKEYCRDRKISINVFEKRVSSVKEFDNEFYQKYIATYMNKKQAYYDELKPVVEDILGNLKNNKDYSIIDYYLKYKDLYTFNDLCESCNKYHLDIRSLKSFFSKVDVKSNLSYDAFLNQYYVAYNHQFNEKEKEELYNYAKENSIPLNWQNISLLVSKKYKNDNNKKIA